MTLTPLFDAPLEIQIHATAAMVALLLGPLALYRNRRDRVHKVSGYAWIVAMGITALSSFFISGFGLIGPFSPLHLLALLALWGLYDGLRFAIAGNITGHKAVMQSLYWHGILVASLFNFLPGRTVSRMLMPEQPDLGYVVIVVGLVGILGRLAWRRWGQGLLAAMA